MTGRRSLTSMGTLRTIAATTLLIAVWSSCIIASPIDRAEASDPASAEIRVEIAPATVEVRLAPGQSAAKTVSVHYHSGPDATLTVTRHFQYVDAYGEKRLIGVEETRNGTDEIPASARWSSADWIDVGSVQTAVRAGESHDLTVHISAPADAEPGDHRAYLVVALTPVGTPIGVGIAPSFGVRVFVTVPGPEIRRVEGLRLGQEHHGLLPLGNPVDLVASLENAGTVSLRSVGEVVVERWPSGEVGRLALPDERIVPGERARVAANWTGPPNWELFGRYYARYEFADDTLSLATPLAEGFWVINWASVGAAVVAVFAAWLLKLNRVARATGRGLRAGARAFIVGLRER